VSWRIIDAFTANAQFCDSGSQYRSAVFYRDEAQKTLAETSKKRLLSRFKQPIVTEIVAASEFYPAEEDYHQDYYKKNPVRYKFIVMAAAATDACRSFGELRRNDLA
jgi:peptide-methionine (S)-S-oxide reductase